jgi:hypothetical protein
VVGRVAYLGNSMQSDQDGVKKFCRGLKSFESKVLTQNHQRNQKVLLWKDFFLNHPLSLSVEGIHFDSRHISSSIQNVIDDKVTMSDRAILKLLRG